MKLAARCLAALALLAFATPALPCPCGDKDAKTTTASAGKTSTKGAVAKSAKKAGGEAKPAGDAKPAAAN